MLEVFLLTVAVLIAIGIVTFLLLVVIEFVIFLKLRSNFDRDRAAWLPSGRWHPSRSTPPPVAPAPAPPTAGSTDPS
jgi:hypothetical protein